MPARKKRTDAEEADIQRQIAEDPEDSEATDDQLARATSFYDMFPEIAARRGRGRPRSESPKQHVSLRLDADVLEKWKSTGPGWQQRVNAALRRAKAR